MSDDHRCQNRSCVAATPDGPALTTKPDTLCHGCIAQIQERLAQLPHYEAALELFKAKSLVPQGGGTKVGGSTEPGTPINLHIVDLLNEIDNVLARAGGPSARVSDLIRSPDGVALAIRINQVWKRAEAQVGFAKSWHCRIGKCPRCLLRTLGNFSGSDSIQCSNCGGAMTRAEYERVCIIVASHDAKNSKKKEK